MAAVMQSVAVMAADWKPSAATVEIVIPSGPGAGLDVAGRMIKNPFDRAQLLSANSIVVNKPGAGGTLAYQHLNQYPGNGHYISLSSPGIVTDHLMGVGRIDYRDLAAVSRLHSDNVVVIVRADSPVKAGGVDVRNTLNVVYKSGGNAVSDLVGGHVDVVPVAAPAAASQLQSGRVRAIAVTSSQRLTGPLASIPIWKEQGVDAAYTAWRVVVGPQGMTPAQVGYRDGVMAKLVATPEEWKAALEKNCWINEYLSSHDTRSFLEQQLKTHQAILGELGQQK